jgi:hypothetical protein
MGDAKCYVTMTDRFMSGWGNAKGKINKFVIACDHYGQAMQVMLSASKRPGMKYINYTTRKPSYSKRRYYVSMRTYAELGDLWKGDVK